MVMVLMGDPAGFLRISVVENSTSIIVFDVIAACVPPVLSLFDEDGLFFSPTSIERPGFVDFGVSVRAVLDNGTNPKIGGPGFWP